jgi:WD40 repeat protein
MGEYEYSCFADERAFLSNREGDIASYDRLSKDTVFVEKQHPSMFHPLQMHTIGELFLTCGGNIKNGQGDNEKIVKLWRPTGDGELEMGCRILTGHNRPIDNSLILGRNRVITLSSDLTIRSINLCTQQIEAIFPVSMSYYSGCEVDWNSAILGGIGANLSIFDFRGRRAIGSSKLPFSVTQISAFTRINTHHYLFANANVIYRLDIRKMAAERVGEHEGERISAIKVLGPDALLLANHDKSLQVWQVCD